MAILKKILVGIVAIEHIYILILEMFLWTSQRGLDTFGMTLEEAQISAPLAANQGLYNGFLAAGLIWSLLHPNRKTAFQLQLFFLLCVIIAAVYGGFTAGIRITIVQGVPALIALIAVWFTQE